VSKRTAKEFFLLKVLTSAAARQIRRGGAAPIARPNAC
jgi:hypothetical protein